MREERGDNISHSDCRCQCLANVTLSDFLFSSPVPYRLKFCCLQNPESINDPARSRTWNLLSWSQCSTGPFYFECYFKLLACLSNPALIRILNVDVDADKSVSNNSRPPSSSSQSVPTNVCLWLSRAAFFFGLQCGADTCRRRAIYINL